MGQAALRRGIAVALCESRESFLGCSRVRPEISYRKVVYRGIFHRTELVSYRLLEVRA